VVGERDALRAAHAHDGLEADLAREIPHDVLLELSSTVSLRCSQRTESDLSGK
jgi:hypothetical protein